jgi:phosphoenolpyruvate carboxykinase (ATP)
VIERTLSFKQDNGVQLRFAGQVIRIEGDIEFNMDTLRELSESVTEMTIDQRFSNEAAIPRVVYSRADDVGVQYDRDADTLHLSGPARNFGRGTSLVYLAEYLAACTLAERQGDFLTHAAATYNPETDCSQILFGEKGAGKTTLAIRVCKEGGYQIIGNDQVYIGSNAGIIHTTGGNAWFNIRRTAITSDDYLEQIITTRDSISEKPAWNDKIRIAPEQLGIVHKIGKVVVGNIFHVRIDHTQDTLHIAPWGGIQQNLILHERLGRHISGQATPLQDDAGNYLGSLPLIKHEATMKRRDELVKHISNMGITEVFAPDGASATRYILEHGGHKVC